MSSPERREYSLEELIPFGGGRATQDASRAELARLRATAGEVERLREALALIAECYPVRYDYQDNPHCAYCERYPEYDTPPHEANCPWLLASAALATGGPRAARAPGEEG